MEGSHDSEIPLELVVSRDASEVFDLKLKEGESLGLQLKGNQPVFVNRVDKGRGTYYCSTGYFVKNG